MEQLDSRQWCLYNNEVSHQKKNLKPKYPLFPVVSKGTVTIVGWEHIMNYGKLNIFLNTYHYIICNNYYILPILLTLNLL